MGDYKLQINGNQFASEIQSAEEWQQTILRDFNDKLLRIRGDYTLTGYQALYELLYGNLLTNGPCQSLTAKVYYRPSKVDPYSEVWRGEMKTQDAQFDLINSSVETQILDNSWASRFNNVNEQKINLRSITSRNGSIIKSCENTLCQFFDPDDPTLGNYLADRRLCFRIYEVFAFLIRYYTDDTVAFVSDFFDIGGDGDQYWITDGQEIRSYGHWLNPEVSFKEVFDEMDKKLNLWIIIEGTPSAPVLRIEPMDYVFNTTKVLTIDNPESIIQSIDLEQLYTKITVGSDATDFNGTDANYPNGALIAWNEESFNTPGDCEFENNDLDLKSAWKIDSNSIQQAINLVEDFDSNIFLVEIDPTAPDYDAFKFTTDYTDDTGTDTAAYIYNYNLTNQEVINNWLGAIPSEIVRDLTLGYYVYVDSPTLGTYAASSQTLDYTNDSVAPATDVDNIYTTAAESATYAGQFKAPVDGFYRFIGQANISNIGGFNKTFRLRVRVYEDDTAAVKIGAIRGVTVTASTSANLYLNDTLWMFGGNVALADIQNFIAPTPYRLDYSYMTLNHDPIVINTGVIDPLIYIYDIQRFQLPLADFNTLKADITKQIRFVDTKTGRFWDVWPMEMSYSHERQIVSVGKFIGRKPNLIGQCYVLEEGIWNDNCYWLDDEVWIDPGYNPFIITVKTDNAGTSLSTQFTIPTTGGGYNYSVNWGDGNIDTGQGGSVTHTYSVAGTYTVEIWEDFPRIYFSNGGDKRKVLSIEQWGSVEWTSFDGAFYGCENMVGNYIDRPILSGVTDMSFMFRQCEVFDGLVAGWQMSTVTNIRQMFRDSFTFNQDVGSWDVSNVTNMNNVFMNGNYALGAVSLFNNGGNSNINNWDTSSCNTMISTFYGCNSFNQPLSNWDTSLVTTMNAMFFQAVVINQNLGTWDVGLVTNMANMLLNSPLSTANYNALLTGWTGWSGGVPTKSVQNGVVLDANLCIYSLATDAALARAYLIGTKTWTITDGGGV